MGNVEPHVVDPSGSLQDAGDGNNFGRQLELYRAYLGLHATDGVVAKPLFVGGRGLEEGDGEYPGADWSLAARQQGVFGLLAAWRPPAGGC